MRGKKEGLARLSRATGMLRVLEALPHRPELLILNYHRIGDAAATPYDSALFSCTASEFDWQVGYFKQHFPIITLGEAVEIVHGRVTPKATAVLLTFDDGYRDNYDEAFRILKRHGASASFFLPTAFVGTDTLPWWDVIAYLAKHASVSRITLHYPETTSFDLSPAVREDSIREILNLFKRPVVTDTERFIAELEAACGCARPTATAERCFLNFEEAREMQAGGMCFGSHTHTHAIMSKLPYGEQVEELTTSRAILERELGVTIDTLGYPVGKRDTFSDDTFRALETARYSTAFSFYQGLNLPGHIARYDVRRISVNDEDRAILRLRMALCAVTGTNRF